MRIGICGFLKYAKSVLQKCPSVWFVPMGHSNTSSLESLFSTMRAYGADTPQLYQSRIGTIDASKSMLFLERNNKCYETTAEIGESMRSIDHATGHIDGHRDMIFSQWVSRSASIQQKTVSLLPPARRNTGVIGITPNLRLLHDELYDSSLEFSDATTLMHNINECEKYAKASIGLPTQSWFSELYGLSQKEF